MLDISKFVTVNEEGKAVIDTEAYKSAYDAELRKSLDTNSENTRKKLEADLRKQIEEEAKLSAEDKLNKRVEEFEASMAQKIKDFAKTQAKAKMKGAEIGDDEINTYLELVNSEDDIAKIDKLIETRKKTQEDLKKKWQEEILAKQPSANANNGSTGEQSFGATMAKNYQNGSDSNTNTVTAWGK
jgi:hypothetical protein